MEKTEGVYGINLTSQKLPSLPGMFISKTPNCQVWQNDFPALLDLHNTYSSYQSEYEFMKDEKHRRNGIRYYLDILNGYIYINRIIDIDQLQFNSWVVKNKNSITFFQQDHSINLTPESLSETYHGNTVFSHIYTDSYSHNNILSIASPVYRNGKVTGLIISDLDSLILEDLWRTHDRPLLWKFLTVNIIDNENHLVINAHKPVLHTYPAIQYNTPFGAYYSINISLDIIYVLIGIAYIFVVYIAITYGVCYYIIRKNKTSIKLAEENITDAMTGLHNRKVLSAKTEVGIIAHLHENIPVTVIAIDSDNLKKINDHYGHAVGDKVITALGSAIKESVRRSDYGIRTGGDEFNIILIGCDDTMALAVIEKIRTNLEKMNVNGLVQFSYGCYQMQTGDSLKAAFLKADGLLYNHKRQKKQ